MWIEKIKLEAAIIWKLVTCQRITSKRYSTSMGRHLSPRYGQVILVSGYSTAVNWSQHWCTICVQYQSSCATKLARKCEIERWFSCGADGRAGCGRSTDTWLTNFLGWVDLPTHGAPQARFARQSSAISQYLFGTAVYMCVTRQFFQRWTRGKKIVQSYLLQPEL